MADENDFYHNSYAPLFPIFPRLVTIVSSHNIIILYCLPLLVYFL